MARNPRDAQQADGALDHLERLDAADGLLHMRVEVLHAEADAIEARAGKREREIAVDVARIEFDRDFGVRGEIEMAAQGIGQFAQPFAAQQARRAAAPMGVDDLACGRGLGDHVDFAGERLGISVERLVLARGPGVAAAIGAELAAIGHMEIERQPRFRRQRAKPARELVRPDRIGKMRSGRIARVAGHRFLGQNQI